jgi:hypothetical protein
MALPYASNGEKGASAGAAVRFSLETPAGFGDPDELVGRGGIWNSLAFHDHDQIHGRIVEG